jgi:hypothetical protein
VVRGSVSSSVLTTVELGEGSDTDVLSQVDVSGDGGWEKLGRGKIWVREKSLPART